MVWVILGGLLLLGLAIMFPLGALAVLLVGLAYSIGRWKPLDGVPEWGRYALVAMAGVAMVGQIIMGPTTTGDEDDNPNPPTFDSDRPSFEPAGGGGSESPELLPCPSRLEAIAVRRGGGFIVGVDAEYDPRMDWDGDGVSCE